MNKVKILFLAADPSDSARLRLGQEIRDIREKLQLAKQRDNFLLESRESARPTDISQAIFDVEPQIVHFAGHGMNTGELCFENVLGKTQPVQPDALADLFELVAEQVTCVVLNACYSETQAKAIAEHIPFVIGMSKAIGDKAAIAFATGFYKALGAGEPFAKAFKFARTELRLQGIPEYLTPVIYVKKDTSTDTVLRDSQSQPSRSSTISTLTRTPSQSSPYSSVVLPLPVGRSQSQNTWLTIFGILLLVGLSVPIGLALFKPSGWNIIEAIAKPVVEGSVEGLQRGSNRFTLQLTNASSDQTIELFPTSLTLSDNQGNTYKPDFWSKVSMDVTEVIPPNGRIKLDYTLTDPIAEDANSVTFTLNDIYGQSVGSSSQRALPSIQWTSSL